MAAKGTACHKSEHRIAMAYPKSCSQADQAHVAVSQSKPCSHIATLKAQCCLQTVCVSGDTGMSLCPGQPVLLHTTLHTHWQINVFALIRSEIHACQRNAVDQYFSEGLRQDALHGSCSKHGPCPQPGGLDTLQPQHDPTCLKPPRPYGALQASSQLRIPGPLHHPAPQRVPYAETAQV